jgi:hypothetical protein
MNMQDNTDLMKQMSRKILADAIDSGLTAHQIMYVLAHTATSGFFAEGLTREKACARFADVVDNVYSSLEKLGA